MAFDLDRYAATSVKVVWDDLDFSAFRDAPLGPDTLRVLRYMADIEFHTVCYLRDMLVTPSHKDPEVTTFMTMWNREEFWHGEALATVLGIHGIRLDYDELKAKRIKLGWKDRLDPIKQASLGRIVGKDFVATHMTWGAANEWSASAAYHRLAAMERHPALSPLLTRIAKQESRHIAFYATQARTRLETSRVAQKVTRFAMQRFWGPVGSGVMPDAEVEFVMQYLFGDPEGADEIAKLDAHVSALPGLAGLTVVADAFRARGVGAAA